MKNRLKRIARRVTGRQVRPGEGLENAALLKAQSAMIVGDNCSISPRAVITDPYLVRMGDNVRLADCTLFGHEGSINMVNRMLGTTFDAVGPIIIGDNVFVGHGVIILPGTTIGSNTIIGAGAVVKGSVRGGHVYVGSPLRAVSTMANYVSRLTNADEDLPDEWRQLLRDRGGEFDPAMEPRLMELRRAHFFGDAQAA